MHARPAMAVAVAMAMAVAWSVRRWSVNSAPLNQAGWNPPLANGHHETYIDQPEVLSAPATTADGNAILGHIFCDCLE